MTLEHSFASAAEAASIGSTERRHRIVAEATAIRWAGWMAPVSAAACFLVAASLWLGPALLRADLFNGDAAHHVYWFYKVADPQLFGNELSIEYFSSPSVAPLGYRAMYTAIAPFADVLTAAEWLSVPLLALTALFAYLLGRASVAGVRYGPLAGLACAAAAMALLAHIDVLPALALQRTFAPPIVLMCLWALAARRYQWVGVSWLLAALFYPVIIPALGLTACVVFLIDTVRSRALPPKWVWNAALGVASIGIVLLEVGIPEDVGPMVTFEQAQQMPEFGPGGRQNLVSTGGWHENLFLHHRTGLGVQAPILLLAAAGGVAAAMLGRRRWIPGPAIVMGLTGFALWGIARLTMFDLYLPNRHSRWTLAATVIVLLAVGAVAIFAWLREALQRRVGAAGASFARSTVAAAALLPPLAVAAALFPDAAKRWRSPVDQDLERAYAFIETLPKDTLVAAHPDLANYVPLRSKRAVLASTEASVAFTLGYYARYVPRIEASLDATYATDWNALDERLAPFGVDVVLANADVLDDRGYHPPFDARVAELTRGVAPERFILRDPPENRVLFRSGDTVVVEVRKPVAPTPMANEQQNR